MTRPTFDEIDAARLAAIQAKRIDCERERTLPMVGDVVLQGDDAVRVTYVWYDGGVQTTLKGRDSSFYVGSLGGMEFSGTLAPSIPVEQLALTEERRHVSCWTFHHGRVAGGNGVNCTLSVRVWRHNKPE